MSRANISYGVLCKRLLSCLTYKPVANGCQAFSNVFAPEDWRISSAREFGDHLLAAMIDGVEAQVLFQPRFGTRPVPSLNVISWLIGICLKTSTSPLGQCTSRSTELFVP